MSKSSLALKDAIRKRDGYRCVDCGRTQESLQDRPPVNHTIQKRLHVHRIEADGPYSFENCKTVCPSCHTRYRRDYNDGFPDGYHRPMSNSEIWCLMRMNRWDNGHVAVALRIAESVVFSWFRYKGPRPTLEQSKKLRLLFEEAKGRTRKNRGPVWRAKRKSSA